MTNTGGSIIPAKEFEGKLWILADYLQQAIIDACMRAVLEEREACAVIAFNAKTYIEAANAIRARSNYEKLD